MSTIIERKVKKRPVVVHRARKVVNSQDKSLHRSMLSHSRIATGYKKKIAALLGNNRALAHALEMSHIELTNRDKLAVELQRKLTLQSPKRFKGKLQKVCEHLHVIVALLQDILDDCDDFAEPSTSSFTSQISRSSRPDVMHAGYKSQILSETQQQLNNNIVNNNTEINSTPFPVSQPPRLTTVADMSAILEQSILLPDDNMPPILFPEDENQVISNITTRPRSKSRSASSQLKNRGSKIHTESPQSRKSSSASNADNEKNPDNNNDIDINEMALPASVILSSPVHSPKQSTVKKNLINSPQIDKQSPLISKDNCLNDSQNEFISPMTTSNSESHVKKKNVLKKKSKKNILVVKLPCTPKHSVALQNVVNKTSTEEHSDSFTSKKSPNRRKTFIINKTSTEEHSDSFTSKKSPNRRKTFTINKTKETNRQTFVLSAGETKETFNVSDDKSYSKHSESSKTASSLPEPLNNSYDKSVYNCHGNIGNSVESKKEEINSSNAKGVQNRDTMKNNSCTTMQDMDLTCNDLTENFVCQTNVEVSQIHTGYDNSLPNVTNPISNSSYSSFMYGYDPLEGTSKNRKSSILLKKPKEKSTKLSSKIPQNKEKLTSFKSVNKRSSIKKHKVNASDTRIEYVSTDTNVVHNKDSQRNSPTEGHLSLALKDNSCGITSKQETSDLNERFCHPLNDDQLQNTMRFNSNLSETLTNQIVTNKSSKERTECGKDQEVSFNNVQPVVKLNDIWTSVKSPSITNHSDSYVYISDSLGGSILKVDTTPKKEVLQLEKELSMQNSIKDAVNGFGFVSISSGCCDFQTNSSDQRMKTNASKINDNHSEIIETNPEKAYNSDDAQDILVTGGIRKRRGASSHVSYKEPSLSKKLRQGDPFTSDLHNVHKKSKRKEKPKRKSRSCISKRTYFEDSSSNSEDSAGY